MRGCRKGPLPGLLLTAGLLAPWSSPALADAARIDADDAGQVTLGGRVYAEHCAACHGVDREGEPEWWSRRPDGRMPAPPHDDSGHTWHHPDAMLIGIVRDGIEPYAPPGYESDMPAFEGVLTDEEIRAVLAFIKSHWGGRERTFQERVNETYEEAWR